MHVVLQGVRARDVVIVLVLQAPDDPAGLIALAGDRFALDREAQVLQLGAGVRDGKPVIGRIAVGLRKDVLAARRIAHRLHDPLAGLALAGEREVETLRRLAGGIRIEVERRHLLLLRERSRGDKCNECGPLHVSASQTLAAALPRAGIRWSACISWRPWSVMPRPFAAVSCAECSSTSIGALRCS